MATKTTRCFCQNFEFGEFDGENENAVSYDTDCNQTTTRIFAQGHDAKLAGFLVRAEMAGEELRLTEGGIAISGDAVSLAGHVSEAFQAKVAAMLDASKARVAKKAAAEAKRAAKKSAKKAEAVEVETTPEPEPQPRPARAKVGRWVYEGQINPDGTFTYNKKFGGSATIEEGKYTEQV